MSAPTLGCHSFLFFSERHGPSTYERGRGWGVGPRSSLDSSFVHERWGPNDETEESAARRRVLLMIANNLAAESSAES